MLTFFKVGSGRARRYFRYFRYDWAFLNEVPAFVQVVRSAVGLFRLDRLPGGLLFCLCWSEFDCGSPWSDNLCISLVTCRPRNCAADVLGVAQVIDAFALAQMPKYQSFFFDWIVMSGRRYLFRLLSCLIGEKLTLGSSNKLASASGPRQGIFIAARSRYTLGSLCSLMDVARVLILGKGAMYHTIGKSFLCDEVAFDATGRTLRRRVSTTLTTIGLES